MTRCAVISAQSAGEIGLMESPRANAGAAVKQSTRNSVRSECRLRDEERRCIAAMVERRERSGHLCGLSKGGSASAPASNVLRRWPAPCHRAEASLRGANHALAAHSVALV